MAVSTQGLKKKTKMKGKKVIRLLSFNNVNFKSFAIIIYVPLCFKIGLEK